MTADKSAYINSEKQANACRYVVNPNERHSHKPLILSLCLSLVCGIAILCLFQHYYKMYNEKEIKKSELIQEKELPNVNLVEKEILLEKHEKKLSLEIDAVFLKTLLKKAECKVDKVSDYRVSCCGQFSWEKDGSNEKKGCIIMDAEKLDVINKNAYRFRFIIDGQLFITEEAIGFPQPYGKCYPIQENPENYLCWSVTYFSDISVFDSTGYNTCKVINFGTSNKNEIKEDEIVTENVNCNISKNTLKEITKNAPNGLIIRLLLQPDDIQYLYSYNINDTKLHTVDLFTQTENHNNFTVNNLSKISNSEMALIGDNTKQTKDTFTIDKESNFIKDTTNDNVTTNILPENNNSQITTDDNIANAKDMSTIDKESNVTKETTNHNVRSDLLPENNSQITANDSITQTNDTSTIGKKSNLIKETTNDNVKMNMLPENNNSEITTLGSSTKEINDISKTDIRKEKPNESAKEKDSSISTKNTDDSQTNNDSFLQQSNDTQIVTNTKISEELESKIKTEGKEKVNTAENKNEKGKVKTEINEVDKIDEKHEGKDVNHAGDEHIESATSSLDKSKSTEDKIEDAKVDLAKDKNIQTETDKHNNVNNNNNTNNNYRKSYWVKIRDAFTHPFRKLF